MDAEQIKIELTRVIAEIINNHPGPDFDTVAGDAAAAVMATFDVTHAHQLDHQIDEPELELARWESRDSGGIDFD